MLNDDLLSNFNVVIINIDYSLEFGKFNSFLCTISPHLKVQ